LRLLVARFSALVHARSAALTTNGSCATAQPLGLGRHWPRARRAAAALVPRTRDIRSATMTSSAHRRPRSACGIRSFSASFPVTDRRSIRRVRLRHPRRSTNT
jgi:hypothetical protein